MKLPNFATTMFLGFALALGTGAVRSAQAQEAKVSSPDPEIPPLARWSFGAGVGFVGTGELASPSALRGLTISDGSPAPAGSLTPYGTALVEIALTRVVRLALGLQGSYATQLSRERDPQPEHIIGRGPQGDSQWSLGAGMGVRAVLNPGGVVEISPILMLGGFRAVSESTYMTSVNNALPARFYTNRKAVVTGWDARLGLVLEYALLTNLFLRFETYFARLGYGKSSFEDTTPDPISDVDSRVLFSITREARSDLSLTYGVSPSVQLRMSF